MLKLLKYCPALATLIYFCAVAVVLSAQTRSASSNTVLQEAVSLNGDWQVSTDDETTWQVVSVPGTIEDQIDPVFDGVSVYRRTIAGLKPAAGRRLLLRFHGVATKTDVYFCGEQVGSHLGAWTPFEFDVTEIALRQPADGDWEIKVVVDEKSGHNTQGFLPVFAPHFGGIWKPVELVSVPDLRFDSFRSAAFADSETNEIKFELPVLSTEAISKRIGLSIQTKRHSEDEWSEPEVIALTDKLDSTPTNAFVLTGQHQIADAAKWSPENPALYDFRFVLQELDDKNGVARVHDEIVIQTGFRNVRAEGERILFNGKPLIVRGLLNWGYAPPSNAPSLDIVFMRREIQLARERGFNLMKFCLWIPPQDYLDLCDELGMLTWIEYPTWHPDFSEKNLPLLTAEFDEFFHYDRAHPSVILRSLTCETGPGADIDVIRSLYDLCKKRIPGSIVEDDSSWIEWNRIHDFYDDHPYGNNHTWVQKLNDLKSYISERETKPLVLGESMSADTWCDPAELIERVGDARPFWTPGFLDSNHQWTDDLERICGAEALNALQTDSYRYAMLMRKFQIETYRREVPNGGYVITVIRDIPLCGMGLIDFLDREKWDPSQWNWHADNMLLLKTENDARSFESGQPITGGILLSQFGTVPVQSARLLVQLCDEAGTEIAKTALDLSDLKSGELNGPWDFSFKSPGVTSPSSFTIRGSLENETGLFAQNEWSVWIVPRAELLPTVRASIQGADWIDLPFLNEQSPAVGAIEVMLTQELSGVVLAHVESGGHAVLVPSNRPDSFPLHSHWFLRGGPLVAGSESFGLPHEMLVELQHFDLAGDVVPEIQNYMDRIEPLILLWDNHDLKHVNTHGVIFRIPFQSGGSIIVSAAAFDGTSNAAGRFVLAQLINHAASRDHAPVESDLLDRLKTELTMRSVRLDQVQWKFNPDADHSGKENDWHAPAFDDSSWSDIRTDRHWEGQGFDSLDDWAWYRVEVDIPADWSEQRYINFTGVDDHYRLYVNGHYVGQSGDIENRLTAFDERKSWDISQWTQPGQSVSIAIEVYDWYGAGGIFRPVTLSTSPLAESPRMLK